MTFWAITVYFNPSNYHRRFQNYKAFRKASKAQGLDLITVELALKGKQFVLSKIDGIDADKMIQVRSKSVLWHKEQLLNIGLKHLPIDCKYVAWLDCDLIFTNNNWIRDTINALKTKTMVQPFDSILLMDQTNQKVQKSAHSYASVSPQKGIERSWGYGWAYRKEYIDKCEGFYPYNIIGGGDTVQKHAFGIGRFKHGGNRFSHAHFKDIQRYSRNCSKLSRNNIKCINGAVKHMWHGDSNDRQYSSRHQILQKYNYNPNKHIVKNEYDCLEWSKTVPQGLRQEVVAYFNSRNEDGKRNKRAIIKRKKASTTTKKKKSIKKKPTASQKSLISNKTIIKRSHILYADRNTS